MSEISTRIGDPAAGVFSQPSAGRRSDAGVPTRKGMRSPRAVAGVIAVLLALPVTALLAIVAGVNDEVTIHWTLATGFALLAASVFDFRAPNWAAWAGSAAMAALTAIFAIQGLAIAIDSAWLHRIAFEGLGQGFESAGVDLFLIWCGAMLLTDSRDKTEVFGFAVMGLVTLLEVARYAGMLVGTDMPEATKLLFLLPMVWLFLEGRKPAISLRASAERASA